MTSETVNFDDLSNDLTIGYTYNLSGGLSSVTDPFSNNVTYENDKTGRLASVSGDAFSAHGNGYYADNIKYRAFGQIKQIDYKMPGSSTSEIRLEYDNRLRVSHYEAGKPSSGYLFKADYSYGSDGLMTAKDDLLNNAWDRTMQYDFAGRLTFNDFGMGRAADDQSDKRVYEQSIGLDAFSNMTSRYGLHWDNLIDFGATYTNNRKDPIGNESLIYDAAGNLLHSGYPSNTYDFQDTVYDASGRNSGFHTKSKGKVANIINTVSERKVEHVTDGDGRIVIEKRGTRHYQTSSPPNDTLTASVYMFQVWSTVLGASLTMVNPDGTKHSTNVYAGGAVIAKQKRLDPNDTDHDTIDWYTTDPVTGTEGTFSYTLTASGTEVEESEPLGQKVHMFDPDIPNSLPAGAQWDSADDPEWQCTLARNMDKDFFEKPVHCQKAYHEEKWLTTYVEKKGNPTAIVQRTNRTAALNGSTEQTAANTGGTLTRKPSNEPSSANSDGNAPGPIVESSIPSDSDVDLENQSVTVRGGGPYLDDSFVDASTEGNGGARQTGTPTPLTQDENKKLDKRIDKIVKRLETKKCKEFLEGKKRNGQGISIANLKVQLTDQSRRFSGPNSTNITAAQAGLTSNQLTGSWTVSDWFKKNGGLNGIIQAAVGSGGSVYYRNFNSVTTILHENLHVSEGLPDIALANRLGLIHKGTIESASQAISAALILNGCT